MTKKNVLWVVEECHDDGKNKTWVPTYSAWRYRWEARDAATDHGLPTRVRKYEAVDD